MTVYEELKLKLRGTPYRLSQRKVEGQTEVVLARYTKGFGTESLLHVWGRDASDATVKLIGQMRRAGIRLSQ